MLVVGGVNGVWGAAALEAILPVLELREGLIARNLANAETPGYRGVDVDFASLFAGLVGPEGVPVRADAGAMRADGNTVDVDAQMVRLAETGLWYSAAARLLSLDFGRLRTAISEGRS